MDAETEEIRMWTLSQVQAEYRRLDRLLGIDTGRVAVSFSKRMTRQYGVCTFVKNKPQEIRLDFKGLKKNFTTLSAETLHAGAKAENTLDNPDKVKPLKRNRVLEKGEPLVLDVPARTFGVYRLGF